MIGHKTREYVEQNVLMAQAPPLTLAEFNSVQQQVANLIKSQ